jgi:hypothetical protein
VRLIGKLRIWQQRTPPVLLPRRTDSPPKALLPCLAVYRWPPPQRYSHHRSALPSTRINPRTPVQDIWPMTRSGNQVRVLDPAHASPIGAGRADQRFCSSERVWACQDLNLGPHPYQLNAGNRCADRPFPRSRPTVRAQGMRSIGPLVCVLTARPGPTHRCVALAPARYARNTSPARRWGCRWARQPHRVARA